MSRICLIGSVRNPNIDILKSNEYLSYLSYNTADDFIYMSWKRGFTSLRISRLASTIFFISVSTKKLKESMCCFTKPLTCRKAGSRCHLS